MWPLVLVALQLSAALPPPSGCPAPPGASRALALAEPADRLRFIEESMRAGARRAGIWTRSWTASYAALTATQLALIPVVHGDDQAIIYVGAAKSFLALLAVVLVPLPVLKDEQRLARRSELPFGGEEPCELLGEAERMLERDARAERLGRSWIAHAASAGLNVAGGLVLGLGFSRWGWAVGTAVGGMAVGELMIWTQPTDSVTALARYRAGFFSRSASVSSSLRFGLAASGVALTLTF